MNYDCFKLRDSKTVMYRYCGVTFEINTRKAVVIGVDKDEYDSRLPDMPPLYIQLDDTECCIGRNSIMNAVEVFLAHKKMDTGKTTILPASISLMWVETKPNPSPAR